MRINKFLAKCGLGSRRKCDKFVSDGLIRINGNIITDHSFQVRDSDYVLYKNKILNIINEDYLYILNKPRGYVCTASDPKNRKKVIDLIPIDIRLFTIGRLDYNSTGLILLTNNGDISNSLLHPKNKIVKKYYVETDKKLEKSDLNLIKKGILSNDVGIMKANVKLLDSDKNKYIWNVEVFEGKNREIRRIFKHFDISVKKLHRYQFANIKLGNIKSGSYKRISYKLVK